MTRAIINYLFLTVIVILSFLAVRSYDLFPGGAYDESLNKFRLSIPGVLFSIYIIVLQRSIKKIGRLILYFCILLALYALVLGTCFASWGIAVPFAGGIGAYLIIRLFSPSPEIYDSTDTKYFLVGFGTGLLGVTLFYIGQDRWPAGVGFGLILIIWQSVIGFLWIDEVNIKKTPLDRRESVQNHIHTHRT